MIHTAILRAAAMLVPRDLRADWLDEWAAELAFVRYESPRRATLFCLGAFRDSLWIRRNSPASESRSVLLDSPLRCLLVLTALAVLSVFIAWHIPATRAILEPFTSPDADHLVIVSRPAGKFTEEQYRWLEQHLPPEFSPGLMRDHGQVLAHRKAGVFHAGPRWRISIPKENGDGLIFDCTAMGPWRPLTVLLWLAMMSLPLIFATTSLSLGEQPARASARLRLWTFFLAKLALVSTILFFGILDLGSATVLEIRPHGLIVGFAIAVRWAIKDQRRRCPVCLRRLTNPILFGQPAHTFLEWYGTELICSKGHGMMHVPEIPTSCYPEPRWVSLDA
jgi:hypothetical protein